MDIELQEEKLLTYLRTRFEINKQKIIRVGDKTLISLGIEANNPLFWQLVLPHLQAQGFLEHYSTIVVDVINHYPNEREGVHEYVLNEKKLIGENSKHIIDLDSSDFHEIYFEQRNGSGKTLNKSFNFDTNSPEYRVFSELYIKLNEAVARAVVLALYDNCEEGEMPKKRHKADETEIINGIVKNMRRVTGLNKDIIRQKAGSLTLIGKPATNLT